MSTYASVEGYYAGGPDISQVLLPNQGRQITVAVFNASTVSSASVPNCAAYVGSGVSFDLNTLDNGSAPTGLPAVWTGLSFTNCSPNSGKDVMTSLSISVSSVTSSHMTGTFDVQVDGGGPRAGSTLHVFGDFNTDLM